MIRQLLPDGHESHMYCRVVGCCSHVTMDSGVDALNPSLSDADNAALASDEVHKREAVQRGTCNIEFQLLAARTCAKLQCEREVRMIRRHAVKQRQTHCCAIA